MITKDQVVAGANQFYPSWPWYDGEEYHTKGVGAPWQLATITSKEEWGKVKDACGKPVWVRTPAGKYFLDAAVGENGTWT